MATAKKAGAKKPAKKSSAKKIPLLAVIENPGKKLMDTIFKKVKPVLTKSEFASLKQTVENPVIQKTPVVTESASPPVTTGQPEVIRITAAPVTPAPTPAGLQPRVTVADAIANPTPLDAFAALVKTALEKHRNPLSEYDLNKFVQKTHPKCVAILSGRHVTLRLDGVQAEFDY